MVWNEIKNLPHETFAFSRGTKWNVKRAFNHVKMSIVPSILQAQSTLDSNTARHIVEECVGISALLLLLPKLRLTGCGTDLFDFNCELRVVNDLQCRFKSRIKRVLAIVYNTQNYWLWGFCSSSGNVNNWKRQRFGNWMFPPLLFPSHHVFFTYLLHFYNLLKILKESN
jgi:hypothetical protein